ncbi:MAG: murein biosynthesis integral membrane protein MurJ [Deltaproteobacteria bacterium]|nr:murein biosynthesis integral membrane protein MurJ [Deltaproteobacteria bacterium]MCL5791758.1 murein biosynthesis integral membrane protein MurJ [Deltaproteobacteria bacterium]
MSSKSDIVKGAGVVGITTLISRILGLIRDITFAYFFGAYTSADAYFVAFRIPNLLRRLVAEGAMSSSFIPVFTSYHARYGAQESKKISDITFTYLLITLVVISMLGIVFSKELIYLFAPGFELNPVKFKLTVMLNRIMFPFILFISIAALSMGILNSLKRFFIPALSPIILNVVLITFILVATHWKHPIEIVAIGVVVGAIIQLIPQFILLHKKGFLFSLNFDYTHPALKESLFLFLPMAFGAAVYQLNVFVSNVLASFLKTGSISYLYYASRLFEFPQGIFAVSIAIAVLPTIARDNVTEGIVKLKDSLSFSLRLLSFITIPATIGLVILSKPIIMVLFHRGSFTVQDTMATASALMFYAFGLWSVAFSRVITQSFYAMKDAKTPVLIALFTMIINLLLSVWLMNSMAYNGLALATSISSYFNVFYLFYALRKKIGRLGLTGLLSTFMKNIFAASLMAIILFAGFKGIILMHVHYGTLRLALMLLLAITIGIGIYIIVSYMLKVRELSEAVNFFKKRLIKG